MIRETVRAQLPLKIVDLSLIFARVFRAWQKLQPNRVQFQSAQPKHPLQRHRKIPTALEIFRRKTAAEEHCHPENKQKKHRTSNTERRISNSETTFCIRLASGSERHTAQRDVGRSPRRSPSHGGGGLSGGGFLRPRLVLRSAVSLPIKAVSRAPGTPMDKASD